MNRKRTILVSAAAIAVIAIFGTASFVSADLGGSSAQRLTPVKDVSGYVHCTKSGTRCPYAECPYLNRMRETGQMSRVPIEEAATVCPYEASRAHAIASRKDGTKSILLSDEYSARQSAYAKLKSVSLVRIR